MRGAIRIANFAGIPVKLHWSFGLLILWVIYAAISSGLDTRGVLLSVGIVSAIFICVVMHEYGHALTARRFGVTTRDIILSPIGGIARLDHIPEDPRQEMLIALAGPAVNVVIAAGLLVGMYLAAPGEVNLFEHGFWSLRYEHSVVLIIAKINIFLVVFNMIPAFPMDGGRVLRALLSIPFERHRATIYASYAGSAFAAAFVAFGVTRNELILSLIGIFIFLAAGRERRLAVLRRKLQSLTVGQICNRRPALLNDTQLINEIPADTEDKDFLVKDAAGRMIGVVFHEFITQARENGQLNQPVRLVTSQLYSAIAHDTPVEDVINQFRKEGYRIVPVYAGTDFLGSVHRNQLEHLLRGGDPTKMPG